MRSPLGGQRVDDEHSAESQQPDKAGDCRAEDDDHHKEKDDSPGPLPHADPGLVTHDGAVLAERIIAPIAPADPARVARPLRLCG